MDSMSGTEAALIAPQRKQTQVAWHELREIATQAQRDIEKDSAFDAHDDYENVFAMWEAKLQDKRIEVTAENADVVPTWYSSANEYWENEANCPVNDNGVLGGFAHVSPADIAHSKRFIDRLQTLRPACGRQCAVDCGAGIGRVSKFLLLPAFDQVDLVEQSERLLKSVPSYMGVDLDLLRKVRNLYCMGLQEFVPAPDTYDVIWVQWVALYLTDVDLVHFLQRCQRALRPNGWIGIKENVLLHGNPYEIDEEDSSITRSDPYYKSIFRQAGMTLLAEEVQEGFPEELYPVKMYALAKDSF